MHLETFSDCVFIDTIFGVNLGKNGMRSSFPGYYPMTDSEIKKLWNSCTFIFDANVLLEPYRGKHEEEFRMLFFSVLEQLSTRIWLPHQAAHEYTKHIETVTNEILATQRHLQQSLDQVKSLVNRAALISDGNEITSAFDLLRAAATTAITESSRNKYIAATEEITRKIFSMFDGKVGPAYTDEKRAEMLTIAKERSTKGIPPGHHEPGKNEDLKYNDALVWFQSMDFAKEKKTPVVFVTGDTKRDWWAEKGSDRPHPLLIEEWQKTVGTEFFAYSFVQFLKHADPLLKQDKEQIEKAIAEVEKEDRFWSDMPELPFWSDDDRNPFWAPRVYRRTSEILVPAHSSERMFGRGWNQAEHLKLDTDLKVDLLQKNAELFMFINEKPYVGTAKFESTNELYEFLRQLCGENVELPSTAEPQKRYPARELQSIEITIHRMQWEPLDQYDSRYSS